MLNIHNKEDVLKDSREKCKAHIKENSSKQHHISQWKPEEPGIRYSKCLMPWQPA